MAEMPKIETVTIECPPCVICGVRPRVTVTRDGWTKYQKGALVQVAFPEMDADQREMLINGTHPKCWDKMLGIG